MLFPKAKSYFEEFVVASQDNITQTSLSRFSLYLPNGLGEKQKYSADTLTQRTNIFSFTLVHLDTFFTCYIMA